MDLLRIIAMLSIVIIHSIYYGAIKPYQQVDMSSAWGIINWWWMYWLMFLAQAGVSCFVLASGYLLAERTDFRWKSIIKIWLSTFFYAFGICLICVILGKAPAKSLTFYALPAYNDVYWFMTRFIALAVIAPFLSMAAKGLGKREFLILLAILAVLNLRIFKLFYGKIFSGEWTFMWFVFLYFVGAYVKLHRPFEKFRHFGKCYFACGIALACVYMTLELVKYLKGGKSFDFGFTSSNSFSFFTSLCLFLWAVGHEVKPGKASALLTKAAPYVLGVYLITEHPLIRQWIWNDVIRLKPHINSPALLPLLVGSCLALFLVGLTVDYGRSLLFKVMKVDSGLDWLLKPHKKAKNI